MLWNFALSNTQTTNNIFTNSFIYFVWNSIVRISFDAIFCLVTFVTFWCNVWVTFVTFFIYIMCSLMHGQKSFTIFVLKILLKYQVTNWWLTTYLCSPIKKLIFSLKSTKVSLSLEWAYGIRRRSDYITGFIAPAIGPNKSRKPTWLIAKAYNKRNKFDCKTTYMASQSITVCLWSHVCCFLFKLCRVYCVPAPYKPCEFLWFVWTDCWDNKSYYIIISPANTTVAQ